VRSETAKNTQKLSAGRAEPPKNGQDAREAFRAGINFLSAYKEADVKQKVK